MMSIYWSRSFPRSNSSFLLCSGNASQSSVLRLRLREEMFLVDAGPGTPKICMQDELTGLPIKRATRFENKVGRDLIFIWAAFAQSVAVVIRQIKGVKKEDIEL